MSEALAQVIGADNIRYDKAEEKLIILDQSLLPNEEVYLVLATAEEMEQNTMGTTIQNIILMYSVPRGLSRWALGHRAPTAQPATMPRIIRIIKP